MFAAAASAILSGCPDPVDWSDYDGVDLIAERGFDSGLWYFADELTIATGGDADFVTWEEASAADAGTLPSGVTGPAYRLEVVNLFPNGDFESALSGWTLYDDPSGSGSPTANLITSGALSGSSSLELDFNVETDRFWIDLDTNLVGGFPADTLFAFHFDLRMPVQTVGLEINNGTTANVQSQWQVGRGAGQSQSVRYQYPGAGLTSPAAFSRTNTIVLGSDPTWTNLSFGGINAVPEERADGIFDDLRVVRADQGHYLRLPVPLLDSLDPSRPRLISGGTYTISVWVKRDPAAGSDNRIAARLLSAGLDTSVANTAFTAGKGITVATTGPENLEAVADWTQVSFAVSGNSVAVNNSTASNDTVCDLVVEIGRFAGGSEYTDAGSILLAGPSLEWDPN